MSNHLSNQTSPYLLQHSDNPVDWFPWCDEAFEKAISEDKPIFLSIGYSTCHWCHVMAHESFEDNETAEILNKSFISIKVDREERPDIDSIYMSVCQAFTGSGGWPTTIFMTPDKKPFFAGTYFPLNSQYGMPSFKNIIEAISLEWKNNRNKLIQSSEEIINHIKRTTSNNINDIDENQIDEAAELFKKSFDNEYGGFGSAPKFPSPHNLLFLTYYGQVINDISFIQMTEKTLMQMRLGGIFDHIGYGFSRYSTDRYFLAPHFEKMLYDNALLIIAYASAYSFSKNNLFLDTCEKTAEYILKEMTSNQGGFYSAQDADSDGVEGKFYTFEYDEIINVLGEKSGKEFAEVFDISSTGNFEGTNIPNLLKSENLEKNFANELEKLYNYRLNRTKLHLDDKILTSWNSLMISAFCMLYRITKNSVYLSAAQNAQKFIENNLCDNMTLYTSYRNGIHSDKGFLDDYAFYTTALIELYNSTLDNLYIDKAKLFCDYIIKEFSDINNGGFNLCKENQNELFINPKETYDGAIPSGNSVMAYNLVRLYQLTDNTKYNDLAKQQFQFMSTQAQHYPAGYSMYLLSKLIYDNPPKHIIVVMKDKKHDVNEVMSNLPFLANIKLLEHENEQYSLINDKTTYYICNNLSCLPPTNNINN